MKNPLFVAVSRIGCRDYLVSLLETKKDIDVNEVDDEGCTPLLAAVMSRSLESIDPLIKYGANIEFSCQGFTPLMVAVQEGFIEISEALLNAGANINASTPDGMSALMLAARDGHLAIIELLISRGVDVYAETMNGSTALKVALQFKKSEVASLLKKHMQVNDLSPDIMSNFIVVNLDKDGNPI